MAEELQQYIFDNKEDFQQGHFLKLMELCGKVYSSNNQWYEVTALLPTLTEEATTLSYNLVRMGAKLSQEDVQSWKITGRLSIKALFQTRDRMSAWVWGHNEEEVCAVAELDWDEVPVLNISTPTEHISRAPTNAQSDGRPQAQEGQGQAEGNVEEVREEHPARAQT